jgi:hypothetical protein
MTEGEKTGAPAHVFTISLLPLPPGPYLGDRQPGPELGSQLRRGCPKRCWPGDVQEREHDRILFVYHVAYVPAYRRPEKYLGSPRGSLEGAKGSEGKRRAKPAWSSG